MMRVNTSQWLLFLQKDFFFWNFMESEAASDEFALYAPLRGACTQHQS